MHFKSNLAFFFVDRMELWVSVCVCALRIVNSVGLGMTLKCIISDALSSTKCAVKFTKKVEKKILTSTH